MTLIKQQKIEKMTIDFNTGHLIVQGIVRVIDDEANNNVIASRVKEIKINPRDTVQADALGILNVANRIWDYLGV